MATDDGNSRSAAVRALPDRYWFLTWTTYGSWLPGDDRGFVSNIDRGDGKGHRRNTVGSEPARGMRGLQILARTSMLGPPVFLDRVCAAALLEQLHETANHRAWNLAAVAIMRNHIHVVVGVPGDPEPETILASFKSYASRRLNRQFQRPESGRWWTEGGSTRCLKTAEAVIGAIAYVRDQEHPLMVWIDAGWRAELGSGLRTPERR